MTIMAKRPSALALTAALLGGALSLAACRGEEPTGYLEVKLSPASAMKAFVILLDKRQVQPTRGDSLVVRRNVGTAKLELERRKDERLALCDVAVKKNRVTTVTVHMQGTTLRCYIEQA
jgi:hypothetical protein